MINMVQINLQILPHGRHLPTYATPYSAGMDVCAAIDDQIILKPNQRRLIPCGFALALPEGFEAQIRPRSGLALNHGITVLNAPGTIDCDYRGEVGVILINMGEDDFTIMPDMRIAQMVIARYEQAQCVNVNSLNPTQRGAGGFGSTGE